MARMKKFRVMCFVLLLAMVFTSMVACSTGSTAPTTAPATAAPTTAATTTAAATTAAETTAEPAPPASSLEYIDAAQTHVKMTMFFNATWFDSANWGKDIVSQLIMQKTGVDLTIVTPTADDNAKLELMISSGEKLPDFVNVDWMNDCLFKMLSGGRLYSYDELAQKYAPNMLKLPFVMNNRDIWAQKVGNGDGKTLYCFSGTCSDAGRLTDGKQVLGAGGGYFIRQDIYEALGSPALKTPDDLENVLKMVKAQYPNITHPLQLYMPVEGVGYEAHSLFNVSFTFGCGGFDWNNNGTITMTMKNPKYLQALLWVNKLYREGLINISDFTDKQDQQDATLRQDDVFCSVGPLQNCVDANKELAKINPNAKYVPIDPILAPGVDKYNTPALFSFGWMCPLITKDTAYPDRAIKFIEYCCTDEEQAMAYAGREGTDWQWGGPDGKDIVLIGQAKADYAASVDAWKLKYGASKEYSFCGNQYFRDCFTWGLAETDPVQQKARQLTAAVDLSHLQFWNETPTVGSDEAKISTQCADVIKNFVGNCCLASSEAEATAIYDDAMKKIDDLGYAKVEALKSARWQQYGHMFDNLIN